MVDQNTIFGGMLTTLGAAKKTNCDALGIPWEPKYMLIGDGGGADPVPSPTQTKLVNQVYRAQLNQLRVSPTDSNVLIAELVLPADVGGWWMRELALEDKDGVFSAVGNMPPSYKPKLAQNSGRNQVVRMHIITSGTSNIQLKIDPSVVLATREYVDVTVNGVLPPGKVAGTYRSVTIDERGVVQAGSNPTTLAGYGIAFASQPEAEAGTDTNKPMSALRVFQAIAVKVVQATETLLGIARFATQQLVNAGADDSTMVSPKKLASQFPFRGRAVYAVPGVYTWNVPSGVTKAWVQVTGGGGGGGRSSVVPGPSGGGGGGISRRLVDLTGITQVSITVGAGGLGAITEGSVGGAGGSSSAVGFCSATGGDGGYVNGNAPGSGKGFGGDENEAIGAGGVPVGNSANTTFLGGAGGGGESVAARADNNPPKTPGMGGGGRADGPAPNGANGAVTIQW
ncbi:MULTISPECIES: phage tail protein [Pseudomonas]|uniref:phage tail protein n=1 Tax=Pseudomonas TaxID=286 RepID=UPI000B34E974|nr:MULTISPECIES: phage tail protein [Pseudomonas]PMY63124.1 phage tail protein [Pseudomonas sp. FW305-25]PMY66026.1 phage tail protein [Pseudomonas sp. FW126-L8]PNA73914.1 phage tail protein [Pseudomonas sp. FW305-76]